MLYVHVICYLQSRTIGYIEQKMVMKESKSMFPVYKPPGPTDRSRGFHGLRAVHDQMTTADLASNEEADLALREAKACSGLQCLIGVALLGINN